MDIAATQIYEDEDFQFTQRIIDTIEKDESMQIGTLSINSIEYEIKEGTTKIGRLSNCDIVIQDGAVSKVHAEIEASGGQGSVWICDLNSSNKTKLNNLTLRPTRLYELKDGNVIEFGRVRATYRAYQPSTADNTIIPETPAASRQKIAGAIIPNTPDSSGNNLSSADDDGSFILETQKDDENVFRRPQILQKRQSINIDKKNTARSSISESDDSQSNIELAVLDTDVSENRKDSIFDMETQNFEEMRKTCLISSASHDVEMQKFPTDSSKQLVEINASTNKQLSKLDTRDENCTIDIHDVETQNYMNDVKELKAGRSEVNIQNITAQKFITDTNDLETQNDVNNTNEDGTDSQNLDIDENKNKKKDFDKMECDIHDLETQKIDNKHIAEDISDMETQPMMLDGTTNKIRGTPDAKIQHESNSIINEINNRTHKNTDQDDVADITNSKTSNENVTKSPSLRSSSPESELLNLSSPGVDESYSSSQLNQSNHLLESSDLLEYFGRHVDTQEEIAPNASTSKLQTKTSSEIDNNAGNVSHTSHNENDNDEDIFNAPTQRSVSPRFEALLSNSSETDEKNAHLMNKILKKKRGKTQSEQTDDDSETDAEEYLEELAKKERESLGTLNKSCNESVVDRNDPGTSAESEDLFEVATQQLNNHKSKDTSDSPINQPKINETEADDDIASTQTINKIEKECNQGNRSDIHLAEINDTMPTQHLLPHEASPKTIICSKDSLSKNDQNNMDDTSMEISNANVDMLKSIDCCAPQNLDCEDIDYETAPTQVIGEVRHQEKRNLERKKAGKSVTTDLDDTLERNLHEMFADINNDIIHEPAQMTTQCLKSILESSQSDDLFVKNSNSDNAAITERLQTQLKKKRLVSRNQSSIKTSDTEANPNVQTDPQSSEVSLSTTGKQNILKETMELVDSIGEIITSYRHVNSSRISKANNEKDEDDNITVKLKKKRKKISQMKNKSDTMTETSSENNTSKAISSENNEKILRNSKLSEHSDETVLETNKEVLARSSDNIRIDDAKEHTASNVLVSSPCLSRNKQHAQISKICENDDDLLAHLPPVKISGTISNSSSPSVSTICNIKSKEGVVKGRGGRFMAIKSTTLQKRLIEDNKKDKNLNRTKKKSKKVDKSSDSPFSSRSPTPASENSSNTSNLTNTSDNSDNEDARFKQMANRLLNNEPSYLRQEEKRNMQNTNKSVMSDKKGNLRSSANVSKNPKQSANVRSKNILQTSSRVTRHSNRQNDNSNVLQEEICAGNAADESEKPKTISTVANRKRALNMTEEDIEQTDSKKHKVDQVVENVLCPVLTRNRRNVTKISTDRQSPNIHEYFTKTSSRENSLIIQSTKSENSKVVPKTSPANARKASLNLKTHENADSEILNIKRTKRKINNSQVATHINVVADENINKSKQAQTKTKETKVSESQDKILKIVLHPINPIRQNESQEVELIMGRSPSNVHDENLSIREKSNISAKIFQRGSRTKRRLRSNADIEIDLTLTENSVSSDVNNSDNTSDTSAPKRVLKRRRYTRSSVSSLSESEIPAKKIFKKPTRANQNSVSFILDSSMENSNSRNSQDSVESDASSSSKFSRSKTVGGVKNKGKNEVKRNTRKIANDSTSSRINTSVEIASLDSTLSRTRRNTSNSSFSTSSAKHKVLFTGITEDYGKLVKTLGGSKVEDPAKCTVLVTDKIRRTYKFLCALAKGVPIVTTDWLRDSESAARFLDWEGYILKDPATEAKFSFRLRKSLDKAKEKKLLDGYTVVLTPNVAPPPTEELKDMVTSCGGKALVRAPFKWPNKAVIVSREEDLPNARKFLAKAPGTVTVQSTEFILTGILRQETDFNKYKLT